MNDNLLDSRCLDANVKNTTNNRQDNLSPLELSNPEYSSTAEAHDKDLKMAFMNMIEVLKEEKN